MRARVCLCSAPFAVRDWAQSDTVHCGLCSYNGRSACRLLTLEQLVQLKEERPQLATDSNYVMARTKQFLAIAALGHAS